MRKILLIMASMFSLATMAQVKVMVYLSNGNLKTYDKTEVDSITFDMLEDDDRYGGHEYVDLGLPSGLKWATCNIGANAPEEYGDLYEWAETKPRAKYGAEHKYTVNGKHIKYNKEDGKLILDPEDDVAYVKWGEAWRMPTIEEMEELFTRCKSVAEDVGDVRGVRLTGPNGNSIFMPLAGQGTGSSVSNRGFFGIYWSSSLQESNIEPYESWRVILTYDGESSFSVVSRVMGHSVRAVTE